MLQDILLVGLLAAASGTCTFVLTPDANGTDVWQFLTAQTFMTTPYVLCLSNDNPDSSFVMGYSSQISLPSSDVTIQCDLYRSDCSNSTCIPQVINIVEIFNVNVIGSLTFINVTLTGKYLIGSNCTQEWCTHCLTRMYLYQGRGGEFMTAIDQHVVDLFDTSAKYYTRSQCSFYQGSQPNNQAVFFTLTTGASLLFKDVEIDNIRVQAQNFILATDGNYVGFLNTSIIRMDFAQAFLAESSSATTQVVVEFNGAYVTGFNRDHPYSLAYGLDAGLLYLKNSYNDTLYIRNSVFEYNFMLIANAPYNQFINVAVTHLEISSSVFRSCMGGLYFDLYDSGTADLVAITNATFDSNVFHTQSLFSFNHHSGNRLLLLENSAFINNVAYYGSILWVANTAGLSNNGLDVTITNLNMTNNRLASVGYCILTLESLRTVTMKGCVLSENLVFESSFPYNIFAYMLDNGLINDSPDLRANEFSAGVIFAYQLIIDSPASLSATQLLIHTSEHAAGTGLCLTISNDAIDITDSSFSSFDSTELLVYATDPTSCVPVVHIKNCDFIGPSADGVSLNFSPTNGGGIIVDKSRFYRNGYFDQYSGGISMYGWFMNITNCVFDSNQATIGGAVILQLIGNYTPILNVYHRAVYIINSQFINNSASLGGGDIDMESYVLTFPLLLYIGNCTFTNSTSPSMGGSILLGLLTFSSVLIDHCTFALGYTYIGGMIHASDISGAITIRDSRFSNIVVPTGNIIRLKSTGNTGLTLSNTYISQCTFAVGVYVSISLDMRVTSTSSRYESNHGIVIWNNQGTFSDSDSVFDNNTYTYSPCYFQNKQVARAEFTGTVFTGNRATDTIGAVMISAGSTAAFTNCRFEHNSAGNMTGVMQIEMSNSVTISGCEFLYNSATSAATLYILEITKPLNISDSVFIGNAGIGLLQMSNSNINARNLTIMKNQSTYIPGFILIQSNLTLIRSSITQTSGYLGCVLYGVLESNFMMTESVMSDIACEQESLLLLSDLYSELSITQSNLVRMSSLTASVISLGNFGRLVLDSVQVRNIESPLAVFSLQGVFVNVTQSLFTDTNAVVLLAEQNTLFVSGSSFENVTAHTEVGAVNCTNCGSVTMSEVTFTNVSATNTAGVSVTRSKTVSLRKCRFEGLTSGPHGAVTVESDSLNITDSYFLHNQATDEHSYGGAAVISTTNSSVLSGNVFRSNSATNGGALCFTSAQAMATSNVFEDNSAVYGNDISSYAVNMSLVNVSAPEAVSGQVFRGELYVQLLDHYGQVMKTDNSSIAWMSSNSSLAGNLKGTAYQGVFNFSQFTITDTPNSPIIITITSSHLSSPVALYLRPCIIGEIISARACALCKPGTYSVTAGATACSACLPHAECPGNSIPYPRPGYWRPDEWYDGIFECPLVSACLGNANNTNSTGVCALGYTGNMCQSCASNHTRCGKDMCTPCLSSQTYIIGQTFLALGISLFIVMAVVASLASASNEANTSGALVKMFLNYLHFTVLVAHFNMLWPDELQEMFAIYEYLGNSGEQFVIWDCSGSELYFREMVLVAVLPAALILANLLLWAVSRLMCFAQMIVRNCLCSLTVTLVFVHPLVVRVAFSAFRCITIKSGEYWLRFEMNINCWDATHTRYALAAALPTLMLWGFGLPLLVLFFFIKYRKQFKAETNMRRNLSFLCLGYQPSFFYWELVKMWLKVLILMLYVFMSYEHISEQALTLCVLLWVSAALQIKYSVFETPALNKAELRGIWVSIITTYSGIWYSSQAISYSAQMVLFVIIVLAHVHFLTLWSVLLIRTLGFALIKAHPQIGSQYPRFQRVFSVAASIPSQP